MNLKQFRTISDALRADLDAAFKKHGLELTPTKFMIDESTGAVSGKFLAIDPATGTTPDAERFKVNAPYLGMKADWLGQEFENGRYGTFKVIGMSSRGDKCVLLEEVKTGKKGFKADPKQIIALFARKEAASVPPTAKVS